MRFSGLPPQAPNVITFCIRYDTNCIQEHYSTHIFDCQPYYPKKRQLPGQKSKYFEELLGSRRDDSGRDIVQQGFSSVSLDRGLDPGTTASQVGP